MADKKGSSGQGVSVSVGGNVSGKVNVAGRDLHVTESSIDSAALEKLFEKMSQQIDALPQSVPTLDAQTVADIKPMVEQVKTEVVKGDQADTGAIERHFRMIAKMAPDILDVVTATLVNPAAGIGVAIQKIAKKAREDAGLK